MANYVKPKFKHDCNKCVFLGNFNGADLYYCGQDGSIPTVIARTGRDSRYQSGMVFAGIPFLSSEVRPELRVAYLIASDSGLIK